MLAFFGNNSQHLLNNSVDTSILNILAAVRLLVWIILPSNLKKSYAFGLLNPEARISDVDSGSLIEITCSRIRKLCNHAFPASFVSALIWC